MMSNEQYDIVIVGGGIVGLTFACMLAQETTLSIAIVESQANIPSWSLQDYHHRVSNITLASKQIFQHLQVWPLLKQKRISPFHSIAVWNTSNQTPLHFDSKDIAERYLGYIIENNVLQLSLKEKLSQYGQVTFYCPLQLKQLEQKNDEVILLATDGKSLSAKLAIGADGPNSWIKRQANISTLKQDYGQTALVATVETSLPHQQIARQVFLESGPLAFLPLASTHLSSIVWTLPTLDAKKWVESDAQTFMTHLGRSFSHRLGNIINLSERYVFPLFKQQANQYVKSRIILMGDAAHSVHPLAGLGVNLGLMDAATLLDVLITNQQERNHFSHSTGLRRYERSRRADIATFMGGIDLIKQVFSQTQFPFPLLSTYGLEITNHLPWLKKFFSRLATGKRKGLPRLAT